MSTDPTALEGELRRLVARDLSGDPEPRVPTVLARVVAACVEVFAVDGSGIMLADEADDLRYVAASDGQARLLEELESTTRQGPCTTAFVLAEPVGVADIREEEQWPELRRALASEPEVRAVLGVPVRIGGVPVGTIDVFRSRPHDWTARERSGLVRYADVVATTLSAALEADTAGRQAAQLQHALDYRVVIERGVGYLMARDGVDTVTAFNTLRSAARSTRTKIGRVAQQLLDTGELPGG